MTQGVDEAGPKPSVAEREAYRDAQGFIIGARVCRGSLRCRGRPKAFRCGTRSLPRRAGVDYRNTRVSWISSVPMLTRATKRKLEDSHGISCGDECAICLCVMDATDEDNWLKTLKCGHTLHARCLSKIKPTYVRDENHALMIDHRCPLCREPIYGCAFRDSICMLERMAALDVLDGVYKIMASTRNTFGDTVGVYYPDSIRDARSSRGAVLAWFGSSLQSATTMSTLYCSCVGDSTTLSVQTTAEHIRFILPNIAEGTVKTTLWFDVDYQLEMECPSRAAHDEVVYTRDLGICYMQFDRIWVPGVVHASARLTFQFHEMYDFFGKYAKQAKRTDGDPYADADPETEWPTCILTISQRNDIGRRESVHTYTVQMKGFSRPNREGVFRPRVVEYTFGPCGESDLWRVALVEGTTDDLTTRIEEHSEGRFASTHRQIIENTTMQIGKCFPGKFELMSAVEHAWNAIGCIHYDLNRYMTGKTDSSIMNAVKNMCVLDAPRAN
jgi:hypothetical protein